MNAARRAKRRKVEPTSYGVRCPVCNQSNSRVIDTGDGPGYVRRRRLCLTPSCLAAEEKSQRGDRKHLVKGVRWTTYEYTFTGRERSTVSRGTNPTNSANRSPC